MTDYIKKIGPKNSSVEFDGYEHKETKTEELVRPTDLIASLKEKALLLDHLCGKEPTNKEVEAIRLELELAIKELEALNV